MLYFWGAALSELLRRPRPQPTIEGERERDSLDNVAKVLGFQKENLSNPKQLTRNIAKGFDFPKKKKIWDTCASDPDI